MVQVSILKYKTKELFSHIKNFRHQLIVEILCFTGMKISEVLNINVDDINMEFGTIKCGDKKFYVYGSLIYKLQLYIRLNHISQGYLFLGRRGRPLSVNGVKRIIKKALMQV